MRFILIYIFCTLTLIEGKAQTGHLTGYVATEEDDLLPGALVWWDGTQIAVTADVNGAFSIPRPDTAAFLKIQYIGYDPATVLIKPHEQEVYIQLSGVAVLNVVEVSGTQKGNYVTTVSTRNVEHITSSELKKAACCNLAESFETNASVDVGHGNAITGTAEVQMLGLRGIYSQLLTENRPAFTGLAQPFALEYIPGTWIESIQISKGASSVANGPQSMTGQINTELVKPHSDAPLFVNVFANHLSRVEGNIHLNKVWQKGWSTGLLLHGSGMNREWDFNKDGFRDTPLKNQLNGMFRAFYDKNNIDAQINVHAIRHRQEGGQMHRVSNPWRIQQDNDRIEVFGKIGTVLPTTRYQSIGFIYNTYFHQYGGRYGSSEHLGTQRGAYFNLLYNRILSNPVHNLTTGISSTWDDIREQLAGRSFDRKDYVNGAFLQYGFGQEKLPEEGLFSLRNNVGLILGVRADHHQRYGWYITPRANLKVNLTPQSVVRLSAGRGWRNPNFPPDWQGMLFSNRTISVNEDFRPEDAWVYGFNYTHKIRLGDRYLSLIADAFHTAFTNQIVMDMESNHTAIIIYNLKGRSYSNSILLMGMMEVMEGLEIKLAWKYNEVKTTYFDQTLQMPLLPVHRGLATIDYSTRDGSWKFNLTSQLVGPMRLPSHAGIPTELLQDFPEQSPVYALFNGQISWTRKNMDIYLGGENIGNYTQRTVIVDAVNPDSPHFDANRVFAPVLGTRVYAGIRYSFTQAKSEHP